MNTSKTASIARGSFSATNGILVTECGLHYANGELAVSPSSMNPRGIVHGGCLSALMDTVAGIAACTDGRGRVTLNCSVSDPWGRPEHKEGLLQGHGGENRPHGGGVSGGAV